jgi:hypothetical protein
MSPDLPLTLLSASVDFPPTLLRVHSHPPLALLSISSQSTPTLLAPTCRSSLTLVSLSSHPRPTLMSLSCDSRVTPLSLSCHSHLSLLSLSAHSALYQVRDRDMHCHMLLALEPDDNAVPVAEEKPWIFEVLPDNCRTEDYGRR